MLCAPGSGTLPCLPSASGVPWQEQEHPCPSRARLASARAASALHPLLLLAQCMYTDLPPAPPAPPPDRYVEAGATEHARELGGKGSDCHKAAVIGDTGERAKQEG